MVKNALEVSPIGMGNRGNEASALTTFDMSVWTNLTVNFALSVGEEEAQKMLDSAVQGVEGLGEIPSIKLHGWHLLADFGHAVPAFEDEKLDALHEVVKNLKSSCTELGRYVDNDGYPIEGTPEWQWTDTSKRASSCEMALIHNEPSLDNS